MRHAGFAQALDQLAATSRRIVEAPDEYPKAPDLLAELEGCAALLVVAAKLVEKTHPLESALFTTRACQARVKIAMARDAST